MIDHNFSEDLLKRITDATFAQFGKERGTMPDPYNAAIVTLQTIGFTEWHPVDTAPEDGSQILVAWRGPAQRLGAEFAEVDDVWLTTVIFFHDGDWQLVETDTHAFDAKAMLDFELWKPIDLPKEID